MENVLRRIRDKFPSPSQGEKDQGQYTVYSVQYQLLRYLLGWEGGFVGVFQGLVGRPALLFEDHFFFISSWTFHFSVFGAYLAHLDSQLVRVGSSWSKLASGWLKLVQIGLMLAQIDFNWLHVASMLFQIGFKSI